MLQASIDISPAEPCLPELEIKRGLAEPGSCAIQVDTALFIGITLLGKIELRPTGCRLLTAQGSYDVDLEQTLECIFQTTAGAAFPLAIGYIAYEFLHSIERIDPTDQPQIPLICFSLFGTIQRIERDEVTTAACTWKFRGTSLKKIPISAPFRDPNQQSTVEPLKGLAKLSLASELPNYLNSNFSKERYCETVAAIQQEILLGEVYQVNLSQKLNFPWPYSAAKLHTNFVKQTAPYKAYLHLTDDQDPFQIISISPELFFSVSGSRISTRPIKGTRPRGSTRSEDQKLKQELLSSPKDRAELAMIVDLMRNDLSRICQVGSVKVAQFPDLAQLQHVFHTFATISGELCPQVSFLTILKALFPCGSITGAPKIAAMNLISRYERSSRGVYCGAIGYIGSNRSASFNVAIRTITCRRIGSENHATLHSGGGITLQSDPGQEYIETLVKLRGLFELLAN